MKKLPSRGFTLIEALVGILLIGLILILFQVTLQNIPLIKYAKNRDIALKIAEGELETLRSGGYDALPATGSFTDSQLSNLPGTGSGALTVTSYNDKTKQVAVTVTWRELNASSDSTVSLTTLITQEGGL